MKPRYLFFFLLSIILLINTAIAEPGQVAGTSGIPGISSSPVSPKVWKKINMAIEAEDFKSIARLSYKSFSAYDNETHLEKAYLRYLHLYAIAGLLRAKDLKPDIALMKIEQHKDKLIMFPHKPKCKSGQVTNNCYVLTEDGKLSLTLTNFKEDYTHIKAIIETFEKPNLDNYNSKNIFVFGTLSSYKTPLSTVDVALDITITKATLFQSDNIK